MKIDKIELAKAMARENMTWKQLAYAANVSTSTLYNVRHGISVGDNTAFAIAHALNTQYEALLPKSEADGEDFVRVMWEHATKERKEKILQVVVALLESESFA